MTRASCSQNSRTALVSLGSLRTGDVLLCYKDSKTDPVSSIITAVTKSKYTHAAICVDNYRAAESLKNGGVQLTNTRELVERYDHVAVFRQPDAWSAASCDALRFFINAVVASGAKYNLTGVVAFRKKHAVHQLTLTDQLKAYFKGELSDSPLEKDRYFCSELVADCFVATGFLSPSAAVVYKPEATSPAALGCDPTFGTFFGYVSTVEDYAVPDTDEFYSNTSFSEIFGND